MFTEIAVLVDESGVPSDFFSANEIIVFVKSKTWNIKLSIPIDNENILGVAQLRATVLQLVNKLEYCRIIAAKELSGIPFAVFDMAKFCIFTVDEVSESVFDVIANEAEQAENDLIENICYDKPVETAGLGNYLLNLIKLQTKNPEISSKMALTDFFADVPFMELRLKCSHIPPWIEKTGKLEVNKVTATEYVIRKKQCRE